MAKGKYHEDEIARRKEHLKANRYHRERFHGFDYGECGSCFVFAKHLDQRFEMKYKAFSQVWPVVPCFDLKKWRTMIHMLNMKALVMEERLCVAAARMGEHTAEEMKKGTSGRKSRFSGRGPKHSEFRLRHMLKPLKHRSYD